VLSSWWGHCERSPGSFGECRLSTRWQPTPKPIKPTGPVRLPVGCYHPHPPLPFISITPPESWYSFYHATEGGRLSQPRHCSKGVQPMPKGVYLSGCHDKHNYPQPLIPQSIMPPLNHCDLQRHAGVNNLPKLLDNAAAWNQTHKSQPSSCKSTALTTRLLNHLQSYNGSSVRNCYDYVVIAIRLSIHSDQI